MSLDVSLTLPRDRVGTESIPRIFIRRNGGTEEITRAEWDELNPGSEPVAMVAEIDCRVVYEANITHNLGRMARECDLYEVMWRPDELGYERAGQLIVPLRTGLARLSFDRERLQHFNPPNGWGDYDALLRFTANYLAACEQWPDAEVRASR